MQRFSWLLLLTLSAASPLVCFAQSGFGQGSGGGGGGGGGFGGGGGGMGGGGMGGGGFGGGGMGGSGMGGNSFGGGGSGNSGFGGTGGFGQNTGMGGMGMGGQQQTQQGFLGRTTNQQGGFLGRTQQGQQGQQGQMGNQQLGGNRRAGGNRNGNPMMNMANQQQQQMGGNSTSNTRQFPQIRPRQKVGFEYSRPQLTTAHVGLVSRFKTKPELHGVNVTLESTGEIVMRGEVASVEKAKLAENLARLEPGVVKVRNELTYPTATPGE